MVLRNKRGQIFSTDLILGLVVFLFILTVAAMHSSHVANRLYFLEQDAEMKQAGMQAANALLLSRGSPANWHKLPGLDGVSSLGLADNASMLNLAKMRRLSELSSSDYDGVKELLGLAKFDFELEVKSMQNNFEVEGFGKQPELESVVVSINRLAFFDGNNVVVRLKVFE